MNDQLKFLIEIQELDSTIISIVEKIQEIPRKLDQFKTPLKESHELFQKTKSKQDLLNKKKKDRDMQLDELQDKIKKLKDRSSGIKTNKEYEAHLKEIQGYEKNISKIEDEILAVMEELDTFGTYLKEEELKLKKAENEFQQQERTAAKEQGRLQAELETEKAKRSAIVAKIDEGYYIQYKSLMKRYGDRAVVETKNEICLGCNTNIPPQLYNDIKKGDVLHQCFFCKRYLYIKAPALSDNQAQDEAAAS